MSGEAGGKAVSESGGKQFQLGDYRIDIIIHGFPG